MIDAGPKYPEHPVHRQRNSKDTPLSVISPRTLLFLPFYNLKGGQRPLRTDKTYQEQCATVDASPTLISRCAR
jgi:hypothetical protein